MIVFLVIDSEESQDRGTVKIEFSYLITANIKIIGNVSKNAILIQID